MLATPALAESSCGPRADIVAKLAQEFKENQQAVGFVNENAVLEVFVSGNGSWTIIATGTDGKSCLLSAGQELGKHQLRQRTGYGLASRGRLAVDCSSSPYRVAAASA